MDFRKNIPMLSRLAWRNVWKNKRRTVLTLLTIMAGASMIIFMRAFQDGSYEKMIEDAISANTGHIQIHEKGFQENMSIDYAFQPSEQLIAFLIKTGTIEGLSVRVHAAGLISFRDSTSGALVQAVDPAEEIKVGALNKSILSGGRYLGPEDRNQVIMGHTLAKNLGAKVGDTVSLISQGFDGSIAAENLTVAGLFKTGNPEYDRFLAVMPLALAEDTFSMMGYVHSIALRLKNTSDTEETRDRIKNFLAKNRDGGKQTELEVLGWDELQPEIIQHIILDRASAWVIYGILFLIVAFGMLNTIQMSVFERTREFGIMMAIGTKPEQVLGMILFEAVYISIAGIILGVLLGSALSWYFYIHPLSVAQYAEEMQLFNIATTEFPTKLTIENLFGTSLIVFIISLVFTIPPARRAARLRPLEAIRQL